MTDPATGASVWQMPVATMRTSTWSGLGDASSTVSSDSGAAIARATAAVIFMRIALSERRAGRARSIDYSAGY